MTDLPKKPYWRPDEIALLLDVDRTTVYRWIDFGRLKAGKYGGRILRVARGDLIEFIQECKLNPLE